MTFHSVGPDYCVAHHGIREEDRNFCDFRDHDEPEHRCPTCDGKGSVPTTGEGRDGFEGCPDCEEGITLCDLRPLGYLTASAPAPARRVHHRSPYRPDRYPACQVRPGLDLSDDPAEVTCRSCIKQYESGRLERDRVAAERIRAEEAGRG